MSFLQNIALRSMLHFQTLAERERERETERERERERETEREREREKISKITMM